MNGYNEDYRAQNSRVIERKDELQRAIFRYTFIAMWSQALIIMVAVIVMPQDAIYEPWCLLLLLPMVSIVPLPLIALKQHYVLSIIVFLELLGMLSLVLGVMLWPG